MKKKLGKEVVKRIFHGNHEDYELFDRGVWKIHGNYEYCNRIFKDQDGDLWKVIVDRPSGSITNQYYQYNSKIIQVEQKKVIVLKYFPTKEIECIDVL